MSVTAEQDQLGKHFNVAPPAVVFMHIDIFSLWFWLKSMHLSLARKWGFVKCKKNNGLIIVTKIT